MGRPVRFVDGDDVADARAESELRAIAEAQGFREIAFEYEPLAAARDYRAGLTTADDTIAMTVKPSRSA